MKFLLVGILLFASATLLKAEYEDEVEEIDFDAEMDMNDYLAKCKNESKKCRKDAGGDYHKILQCVKDFAKCIKDNRPKPTVPPFVLKCNAELKKCMTAAGGSYLKKMKCLRELAVCLRDNRPKSDNADSEDAGRPRPSLPPYLMKCKAESVKCMKAAGGDPKKMLQCRLDFVKCIRDNRPTLRPRPTLPDFLLKCKAESAKCMKAAGDDPKKRWECRKAFIKCIKDNRPTRAPDSDSEDARRPRPSGRPSRRPRPSGRPSRPPFVVKCRMAAKKCFKAAGDDLEKKKECRKAFMKCIKDNRPTRAPDSDSEDARRPRPSGRPSRRPRPSGRPSRPPFVVKCRMAAKKCFKAAGDDLEKKKECRKAFMKCIKENRPRPSGRPSRRPRPSGRPSRRPRP